VQGSSLGGSSTASSDSAGSSTCQTHDFIAQFQMAVAFDAAPVAATASVTEATPPVVAASPESEGEG
jgi:hypothetical protein